MLSKKKNNNQRLAPHPLHQKISKIDSVDPRLAALIAENSRFFGKLPTKETMAQIAAIFLIESITSFIIQAINCVRPAANLNQSDQFN